ncbi:MAG: arsenate reductase (glutaredoxin) [Wenzhouxiangellaceae bacterium]|nr:arsenate reductase (glutaredoxin) [Wenzhouxiangellaceae bacterium]
MQVTVYHNPRCSKSRATLDLLEERGIVPTVVRYLDTPPTPSTLARLAAMLGVPAREMVRTGEAAWRELGLDIDAVDDATLFGLMSEHPILIQRPIVVAGARARIGRPPENVLEILRS